MQSNRNDEYSFDLHTAASIGDMQVISKILLMLGYSRTAEIINRQNVGGWTALHYAAHLGHDDVCLALINNGALVDAKNASRQTPLMLASTCGHDSTVRLLLQYSANVHAIDNRGSTSLFYGLLSSHLGVVEILLSAGAEPNRRNFAGDTSFLLACANGHELIVDACLQYGADPFAKTPTGASALSLATANCHDGIVKLLLEHPAYRKLNTVVNSDKKIAKSSVAPHCDRPTVCRQSSTTTIVTPSPQINHWPTNQRPLTLAEFLNALKLDKFVDTFEEQKIDLHRFVQLNDSDLKQLGISTFGPRKKMLNAIARWHGHI